MAREAFTNLLHDIILSLSSDLRSMMRLMEDGDLDDESRIAAAGSVLHLLSAQNAIPGMRGMLAYVDDALVMRLVVERAQERSPEVVSRHAAQGGLCETYATDLATARDFLGNMMSVLDRAAEQAKTLKHEGHTARQCAIEADSSTWLYESMVEVMVDFDFDEDEVTRAARGVGVDQIVQQLKLRVGKA